MAEAPPCTPSSWSDIPLDIAGLVLRLLPAHADLARFAAVCPKWLAAACAAAWQLYLLPPLPVISLPDGSFYSLPRGEHFRFPVCGGRYHSTCGNWLVFSLDDGFFLVDPFDISVDHNTGDPLVIDAEDLRFMDDPRFEGDEMILTMLYLVESHGALLMVRRKITCRTKQTCLGGDARSIAVRRNIRGRRTPKYGRSFFVPTNSVFEVFEADFGQSRWNKVTTVGYDQVLFLTRWSSRTVCVSKYGMPGNRIFFWDDDLYHDGCEYYHDRVSCSAYDMGDGTVSSPLPTISWKRGTVPATWFFPRD